MKGLAKALILSVAVHCLLATALSLYLGFLPAVELPSLDLSAVEISFAPETPDSPPPTEPDTTPAPEPDPPPQKEPDTAPPPEPDPPPQEEPDTAPPPAPEPPPQKEPDTAPPPEPDPPPQKEPDTTQPPTPKPPPQKEPDTTPQPVLSRDVPISREHSPSPAPQQARIDAPPRPLKNIRPDYPKGARQRSEEGDVVLELSITERGTVSSVSVVSSSGFVDLDAAAVRAAERARFSPAKSGRKAVSSTARITISFRLTQR